MRSGSHSKWLSAVERLPSCLAVAPSKCEMLPDCTRPWTVFFIVLPVLVPTPVNVEEGIMRLETSQASALVCSLARERSLWKTPVVLVSALGHFYCPSYDPPISTSRASVTVFLECLFQAYRGPVHGPSGFLRICSVCRNADHSRQWEPGLDAAQPPRGLTALCAHWNGSLARATTQL